MTMLDYIKQSFPTGATLYLYVGEHEIVGRVGYIGEDYIILEGSGNQPIGIRAEGITAFAGHSLRKVASGASGASRSLRAEQAAPARHAHARGERGSRETTTATATATRDYKAKQRANEDLRAEQAPLRAEAMELLSAYLEEGHPEDTQSLEPVGEINELRRGFQFGFIDDAEDRDRYYFNMTDLVDSRLQGYEGKDILVAYYRTENKRGKVARGIHLPGTIRDLVEEMLRWIGEEKYFPARQIMENITRQMPELSFLSLLRPLLMQLTQKPNSRKGTPAAYTLEDNEQYVLYNEARALMQDKAYPEALQLYRTCIAEDVKRENSIKDTIQIYITLYVNEEESYAKAEIHDQALDFIQEHRTLLPDEMSTLFVLENAYFALGEYAEHIEITERIVALSAEHEELDRYIFYLNKLAQSYLRYGETDKAMDAAKQGLEVAPTNPHLLKTKQAIEEQLYN